MIKISERAQSHCLPPLLESGAVMRQVVSAALERMDAGPEEASDMVLAVSEAFNNAISHGSIGRGDYLWLEIDAIEKELVVTLAYSGAPFPLIPPTLPEPGETHGRGRYLMERLTDRVSYTFDQDWTRVELRKRVRGD